MILLFPSLHMYVPSGEHPNDTPCWLRRHQHLPAVPHHADDWLPDAFLPQRQLRGSSHDGSYHALGDGYSLHAGW